MIHPFLNMTINGAIWYQGTTKVTGGVSSGNSKTQVRLFVSLSGEANAEYHKDEYNCSFPAMIDDWRLAFHQGSGQQTAPDFPFGFVQVCSALEPKTFHFFIQNTKWFYTEVIKINSTSSCLLPVGHLQRKLNRWRFSRDPLAPNSRRWLRPKLQNEEDLHGCGAWFIW